VLVPADREGSADDVAVNLAEVGKQISGLPVTAITVKSLEYSTAIALADLPGYVERSRQASRPAWSAIEMPPSSLAEPDRTEETPVDGSTEERPARSEQSLAKVSLVLEGESADMAGPRLIFSIPPVVTHPLGLATAHNADLVVVCVELGLTRLANARRTLDLIGRDRVAGCFLVHREGG
jgi:hypothetical protein